MKKKSKINVSHGIIHLVFILLSAACILPLLLVVGISFTKESSLLSDGYHLIPKVFSTAAYEYVFTGATSVLRAYGVTIFVTVV